MSSEQLADGVNPLDAELAATWDVLKGYSGRDTDLGIARRFGAAAAAYSLRDIGAMNGRVVKVRRIQDDAVEDFSALQVASGSIEKFAIGQDVLDLYNNAAYFPTDSDYFSLGSGITLSGAFTISYDVVFTGSFGTNTSRIFQDDAGNDLLTFTTSTTCKFRVGSIVRTMSALSTALQLGRKYSMIFARDGSGNYTLTIDGVQVSTLSGTDTDDFLIQRIGFRNRGSTSNLNINSGQHIYASNGADNSNWTDEGSGTTTNATKVGTPVAFTGQGIDAFVDTWYDQSGNGNNATQSTSGNQPKIISDGSLTTSNGSPSVFFTGDTRDDELDFTDLTLTDATIFTVVNIDSSADQQIIIGGSALTSSGTMIPMMDNGSSTTQVYKNSTVGGAEQGSSQFKNGAQITLADRDDAFDNLAVDSQILFTMVDVDVAEAKVLDGISRTPQDASSYHLQGQMNELIIYNSDLSSERGTIESEIASHYGITLS